MAGQREVTVAFHLFTRSQNKRKFLPSTCTLSCRPSSKRTLAETPIAWVVVMNGSRDGLRLVSRLVARAFLFCFGSSKSDTAIWKQGLRILESGSSRTATRSLHSNRMIASRQSVLQFIPECHRGESKCHGESTVTLIGRKGDVQQMEISSGHFMSKLDFIQRPFRRDSLMSIAVALSTKKYTQTTPE